MRNEFEGVDLRAARARELREEVLHADAYLGSLCILSSRRH